MTIKIKATAGAIVEDIISGVMVMNNEVYALPPGGRMVYSRITYARGPTHQEAVLAGTAAPEQIATFLTADMAREYATMLLMAADIADKESVTGATPN